MKCAISKPRSWRFAPALTGHLVFSTLHTNDAVGVIPRLVDMGIERYLIPAALSAVIGQRLIRRVCPNCMTADPEQARWRDEFPNIPATAELVKGSGCDQCHDTGYRGRCAIFEVLVLDEDFHDAVINQANTVELERIAVSKGMRTMFDDGLDKAAQGVTSVAEVFAHCALASDAGISLSGGRSAGRSCCRHHGRR